MLLPCEQRGILREATRAVSFQGAHVPPRGHAEGGPLGCGVSAEYAPCRSTHGGTWGVGIELRPMSQTRQRVVEVGAEGHPVLLPGRLILPTDRGHCPGTTS